MMEPKLWVVWATLVLSCTLASGDESSCSHADCRDEDLLPEASFLQVNQNITQTIHSALNQTLAHPVADAPLSALHALRPAGPSEVMSLAFMESYVHSERAMNVGGMILDIAVLVLLVVAILLCCSFAFRRSSPAQTDPFMVKESGAAAALLSSQAVPIPVLCKEFVMKDSETRFTMDMAHITNPVQSFPINLPTGKRVLEATLQEGGTISITDAQQEARRMMIRASTSGGKKMLTIYDGSYAFFGKVSAGPDGSGLVMYHMQNPCGTIRTTDLPGFSMDFQALSNGRAVIARSVKKGDELRVQVSPSYDGVLLLGCILGIILLEPEMMKQALR